ncbi:hypothetical protein [Caballeronia zhejiangensis]|uniref:hypothetical protein n=1 Tax=Caballeronia zhejiangensis TaxID=871203 RepID=UPI001EF6C779|nr:hypothetical protein [Caballeronia zhejiangensis]
MIARAIRLHVQSYCASFATRIDALEKARAREPVVNVTSFPVKDHTEVIDGLRRAQEASERYAVEDRRAVDRLLGGIDGLNERVKTLESHEAKLSATNQLAEVQSETINALGRAQESHERQATEDRRALNRLINSFDGITERFKALENRDPIATPAAPAKDHTETLEVLRRTQDQLTRQASEDRRSIDRLQDGVDALAARLLERIKALETRPVLMPKDGEPGRDAFEIDVLPVIDFARDYPRGTLAQHQGGIWRAHANTRGEHGWSCVVDGIARTFVAMDSERSFTVHIERASGAHETATFALPVMIYRGVYHAGETYRCGDVVTWAGSLWHCNATTDTKPDAGGDAWTLAAKRGRDGKDAPMRVVGGTAA